MTRCEKCDAPAVVLSARLTLMPAELCAACNALGDQYRVEIEAKMEQWGKEKGVEIDMGMYLEDESLKAFAQLQFNPSGSGAGVALAQSADKGLSLLLCRPRTLAEVERLRDNEQAAAATASTLTLNQAKKMKPGRTMCRPPNGTYLELQLLIGTFVVCCGLSLAPVVIIIMS